MQAKLPLHPWRRTSIDLKISRNREIWAGPQLLPRGIVEDSPDRVVAHAEQEPEGIPFSEPAAIFHGTKLVRG